MPFLQSAELRSEVHAILTGTLRGLECDPLQVGGVEDHVHILCGLSRKISLAELIKNLKTIAAVLAIACAGETKAGPEAGQNLGTIIVYRPWSIINCAIKNWEFNLNDGPDLMVRNGTYYRLTVLPGDYTISHGGYTVPRR